MRCVTVFTAVVALLLGSVIFMPAQEQAISHKGRIITPQSGIEHPEDVGVRAHTTYQLFVLEDRIKYGVPSSSYALPEGVEPPSGPPFSGYAYETPASLACVYDLVHQVTGCNPNTVTTNPTGGSKAVGIVDAYDYPTAMADLNAFSHQFGLPTVTSSTFKVIYAGGSNGCNGPEPQGDPTGWEGEEALDIDMVHSQAPHAKIFLVEAQSDSLSDLLDAETCAAKEVAAAGGGEVSNSWGSSEFSSEHSYDSYFVKSGVVFFASSGDSAGTIWPSVSPNVVATGGTSNARVNSGSTFGNLIGQAAWEDGGGGYSQYEAKPSYQNGFTGTKRLVPDVSSDANPITGVWVYDNNSVLGCCWYIDGGTSVSSPTWAGIVNAAGHFASSSSVELTDIYNEYANHTEYADDFNDVQYGLCSFYDGDEALVGYDFCTGVGTPKTYTGK